MCTQGFKNDSGISSSLVHNINIHSFNTYCISLSLHIPIFHPLSHTHTHMYAVHTHSCTHTQSFSLACVPLHITLQSPHLHTLSLSLACACTCTRTHAHTHTQPWWHKYNNGNGLKTGNLMLMEQCTCRQAYHQDKNYWGWSSNALLLDSLLWKLGLIAGDESMHNDNFCRNHW